MKFQLSLLFLVVMPVLSLHIEEGCEAKSRWKIPYTWNDYQFSVWTPTIEDPRKALTIEVQLEGHTFPITYDLIHVFRNETVLERVREGKRDFERYPFSPDIPEGWTEYKFTVDSNYVITYGNITVLNSSVEYRPESLQFEGSNITVNCHSEFRVWEASQNPSTLPLETSEMFSLSFYSKEEYLPTIEIEKRSFKLGLSEGSLTTIPSKVQNLLPFEEYHLNFSCRKNEEIKCSVMIGNDSQIVEELRVGDLPQAVTISGRWNDDFYVILRNKNTTPLPKEEIVSTSEDSSDSCKGYYIALGVLAGLTVILIIGLAVLMKYRKAIRSRIIKRRCSDITDEEKGDSKMIESFDDKASTGHSSSLDSDVGYDSDSLAQG